MEQDLILHLDIESPAIALSALFNQTSIPHIFFSPAHLLSHSLISYPEYIAVYLHSLCQLALRAFVEVSGIISL